MTNHVVAVPLDVKLAEFIGKKNAENSLTFYNRSVGDHSITALAPTAIDEKFHAAAETLLLSEQVLLSTASVDSLFGEMLVACGLAGKRTVLTDDTDVSAILPHSGLKDVVVSSRNTLLEKITGFEKAPDARQGLRIDIDRAFEVRGIGTVALGIVERGTVKLHDELFHASGKRALVRSIQIQDRDVSEATAGARLGLALKGITSNDIGKGDLLTSFEAGAVSKFRAGLTLSGIEREDLQPGRVYGIVSGFSYTSAALVESKGAEASFRLDKPLQLERGDAFMLMRVRKPRLFAAGTVL